MKYGGFMAQDHIFLENRLAALTDVKDKRLLVTPPASVLNAYFAELYQKRSPKDATDYFFELSKAFDIFEENPDFQLEGKKMVMKISDLFDSIFLENHLVFHIKMTQKKQLFSVNFR